MNQLSVPAAAILAVLLLAGCAGHEPVTGQVTGQLVSQGGSTPGQRPMAGVVAFTAAGQRQLTARAGSSGSFSMQLPPGHYQVSGPCSQSFPVTVTAHSTTHVNVICIVPVSSPPSA